MTFMDQPSRLMTTAIVMEQPGQLVLRDLTLTAPGPADAVVEVDYTGISTGTERLLWTGRMPAFPGMGYPLVPGYEAVGRVAQAGADSGLQAGQPVFVPGATCYTEARGLFGADASRLVVPGTRALPLEGLAGHEAVLLALAATAYHVTGGLADAQPDLIVGHGALGRLLARIAVLRGATPVVWETAVQRRAGAIGYPVVAPADDDRRDYRRIVDCSGDASLLDTLIARLAPQGELVLAGFYDQPLAFAFPPAFVREVRIRVAAQWQPTDLRAVRDLAAAGQLALGGLVSHQAFATDAQAAFGTAFGDPACTKMLMDWRPLHEFH